MEHSANVKNLIGISLEIAFTLWATYSTYVNTFQKKISKFGLDAFFVFLFRFLADKKRIDKIRHNPSVVKRMALMMAIVSIGGIWDTAVHLLNFTSSH
jgi:hypothetical protein